MVGGSWQKVCVGRFAAALWQEVCGSVVVRGFCGFVVVGLWLEVFRRVVAGVWWQHCGWNVLGRPDALVRTFVWIVLSRSLLKW